MRTLCDCHTRGIIGVEISLRAVGAIQRFRKNPRSRSFPCPARANKEVRVSDPVATDHTYRLEGISDLIAWGMLAQSVGGGVPTGPGFQSEAEVPGQAPFRNVVVTDTAPAGTQRFFRLKVTR